jgi:hypothetical protein
LALTSGLRVSFIAGYANTSDTLLTVNALAAKAIVDRTGVALFNGAIQAGRIHEVVYNGTYFMLLDAAYGVAQTLYDLLTPIGTIRFCNNDTAPVVPPGLTATWTEITSSATFGQVFSIKTGKTTGTSEGSATAALPNHIHSPGNMSVTVTAGATDVAAGSLGSRASPGIYDVNGNTGNPTTSPAISFDFPRHYVKAYFRSA